MQPAILADLNRAARGVEQVLEAARGQVVLEAVNLAKLPFGMFAQCLSAGSDAEYSSSRIMRACFRWGWRLPVQMLMNRWQYPPQTQAR